jgi:hypothetical protein
MSDLFLPQIANVGSEGVVEGFAINVLRMRWQVMANRGRKVGVCAIGHDLSRYVRIPRDDQRHTAQNCVELHRHFRPGHPVLFGFRDLRHRRFRQQKHARDRDRVFEGGADYFCRIDDACLD